MRTKSYQLGAARLITDGIKGILFMGNDDHLIMNEIQMTSAELTNIASDQLRSEMELTLTFNYGNFGTGKISPTTIREIGKNIVMLLLEERTK